MKLKELQQGEKKYLEGKDIGIQWSRRDKNCGWRKGEIGEECPKVKFRYAREECIKGEEHGGTIKGGIPSKKVRWGESKMWGRNGKNIG